MFQINRTPLHYACENKNGFNIAKLLIKKGANVNMKDNNEKTPLYFAIKNNDSELVKLLIENEANPNTIIKNTYTIRLPT